MATADSANANNTSTLTSLIHEATPHVLAAIKHASAATGVDFSYMMEKASAESGLNAKAKSASSSATGLYQFIDSTWMDMVKKYGAKCGLGHLASCIDSNGQVANKATKQEILNLRKDPETAAMMAAEYTAENKTTMQAQLGPSAQIGPTELYLAHFMGAGGATNFMKAYQANPLQAASTVCGKAAGANHAVFYDHSGKARSLAAVYDMFAKKFGTDATPCPDSETVAKDSGSDGGGAMTGNTMAGILLAQSGIDGAAGDTLDETVVAAADNAPVATTPALTVVDDGAASNGTTAGGAAGIHWFSPRLSIARIENAAQLNSLQATVSNLQANIAGDPAHAMLVSRQHHAASHLNGRTRAHDAYGGMVS